MGVTEIARALGVEKQYIDRLLKKALLKVRIRLQAQESAWARLEEICSKNQKT